MRNETDAEVTDVSPKWLGANEYFANDRPGEKCHLLLAYKLGVYSTNPVASVTRISCHIKCGYCCQL